MLPAPSRVLSVTLGEPRRPLVEHAADAARDAARLRALARGRVRAGRRRSTPRPRLRRALMPVLVAIADAADRGDRAADGPVVRLRPHAQGAAGRARDVLPDHGRLRRGLRRQRARGRGAAALDGREPRAHLPLGALPDLAAVLLRRPAHRDHLRRRRRDLRRVRRCQRGPRHLHAEREELVPHRSRAGRRARQRRAHALRCSRSPTRSSASRSRGTGCPARAAGAR